MVDAVWAGSGYIETVLLQYTARRTAAAIMAMNADPPIKGRSYVEGVSLAGRTLGSKPSALLSNNTAKKANKSVELGRSPCNYFFWDTCIGS
jgi:hypothetical protein